MHIKASKVGENGFNTQPPEGGCSDHGKFQYKAKVSTHSHPKVAAQTMVNSNIKQKFQHTATRRWLRLI